MLTTPQVARLLGLTPGALRAHVYAGNIRVPTQRAGNAILWNSRQIEAAKKVLANPGFRRPQRM